MNNTHYLIDDIKQYTIKLLSFSEGKTDGKRVRVSGCLDEGIRVSVKVGVRVNV